MAEATDSIIKDEMRKSCIAVFGQYVEKERTKKLADGEKDNPRGKTTAVRHILTALGLKSLVTNCESIVFPKYQDKSRSITAVQFLDNVLPDLAKDPAKVLAWGTKMAALEGKSQATGGANAAVVNRLTDTSKYTGSHASRFDDSGKGKGAEGRKDIAENDGYVGGYKAKGSFGKK